MSEETDFWFNFGYEKGKESRDAEIAGLREQVATLRGHLEDIRKAAKAYVSHWFEEKAREALAATEPKP